MSAELSKASRWVMQVFVCLIGLLSGLVILWQVQVLSGNRMENPDGSADDWHEQKTHYGIAFADILVLTPTALAAYYGYFTRKEVFAHYLFSLLAYWLVYTNLFCTVTSLRFENPDITFEWLIVFPFGCLVGIAYLAWAVIHFDVVFLRTNYTPLSEAVLTS